MTPPTETFTGEMSIHIGDMTLVLWSDGGHSPGELSVFIPEHGMLLTGDNVFNGRTPYVGDADVPKWLEVLTRLHAMGPEVVIPGHGPVGGKEILVRQRRSWSSHRTASAKVLEWKKRPTRLWPN